MEFDRIIIIRIIKCRYNDLVRVRGVHRRRYFPDPVLHAFLLSGISASNNESKPNLRLSIKQLHLYKPNEILKDVWKSFEYG